MGVWEENRPLGPQGDHEACVATWTASLQILPNREIRLYLIQAAIIFLWLNKLKPILIDLVQTHTYFIIQGLL